MKFPNISMMRIAALILAVGLLGGWPGCDERKKESEFFSRAAAQAEKGRFEEAVLTYRKYLVEFPEGSRRDEAYFNAGRILYYTLDRRADAVRNFSALINQYPAGEYAYEARKILAGVFARETHDYKHAILEYKWLIKQRPESPEAPEFQYRIARCYMRMGRLEQAVLEFGRFLEKYPHAPTAPRVYDELGSAHLVLDRPDEAVFIYRTMIEKYPESSLRPAVEFKMGTALEEMNRYDEALDIYQGLVDRYPNRRAVEIRIAGVKKRKKNRQGETVDVDYSYRPEKSEKTTRNLREED